ncbi:dihydrolipoamide dehydrogenase [Asanoa ishikariensis]|uniref:Dihydrolipoamide dehydrogenase n=1 Tax=Asanoa ishikariensis TaxID=137265 RepID=A0A1H3T163_9ACTN|nr:NAD(P)H-quinone dehydrogenase [Asanoa ishikariensis]GIF63244.1 dihydrolipoamide dehydrogenase [Asanoa ishikariensis]SDZ43079.1 dihydrolipoamide dehydrogenase [Asanoa ishikariensis]
MTRLVILGGGLAGYQGALVGAQLGADVTVVEMDAVGGATTLADCVPSRTLLASAEVVSGYRDTEAHGVHSGGLDVTVDAAALHSRVKLLAGAQSADMSTVLHKANVRVVNGRAKIVRGETSHAVVTDDDEQFPADVILVATGSRPRVLPMAEPDGERILTYRDLYDLPELPNHLVVVGAGVSGVELAHAYLAMGVQVTLIANDRILPGIDPDAVRLIEDTLHARGLTIVQGTPMERVVAGEHGARVVLADGTEVDGDRVLVAAGLVANARGLGLSAARVELTASGHIKVDGFAQTTARGIYAAGSCSTAPALANVAAIQGQIAVRHALSAPTTPLRLAHLPRAVQTSPEIAYVGETYADPGFKERSLVVLPLGGNASAKIQQVDEGFIKLICDKREGTVVGGVIVARRASELITSISMAIAARLTVDQVARTFSVFPTLSNGVTEAAQLLMSRR